MGLLHARRHNYRGALLSLERGIRRLRPFPDGYRGVALGQLIGAAESIAHELVQLGPERITAFDEASIPTITLDPDAS